MAGPVPGLVRPKKSPLGHTRKGIRRLRRQAAILDVKPAPAMVRSLVMNAVVLTGGIATHCPTDTMAPNSGKYTGLSGFTFVCSLSSRGTAGLTNNQELAQFITATPLFDYFPQN